MKDADLIKAFTLKVKGYKTEQVAKEIGVTPTYLNMVLHNVISNKNPKNSVYPALNEFMLTKGITAVEFSKALGVPNNTLASFLKGRTKSYDLIIKVLKYTGLTFEQIFKDDLIKSEDKGDESVEQVETEESKK